MNPRTERHAEMLNLNIELSLRLPKRLSQAELRRSILFPVASYRRISIRPPVLTVLELLAALLYPLMNIAEPASLQRLHYAAQHWSCAGCLIDQWRPVRQPS